MATSVLASATIPLSIDVVWSHLRDFTFPERLLNSIISKVEIDGNNPFHIGTVRKMVWKTGEMRSHRLIGLSDQYHIISWELIDSDPPVETSAIITRVKCIRISEQNHTLVEWSADYGSDVPASFITFEQKSFQENLAEIRSSLTGSSLPVLYHLNEAPSTRVVWLSYELGIPLKVQEATPAAVTVDLRKSRETEMPADKGGMVTSYVEIYPSSNKNNNNKNEREEERSLVLLESGAIIYYLLEKHDSHFILTPKQHTPERALFHKYMFFASSTADHLLFESYKHMYVVDTGEYGEEVLETNRRQWYQHVGPEFEKQLKMTKYLCGDRFTAADIMLGWTLYIATLLGWLEDLPVLQNYFQSLSRRPSFQRAFYSGK